MGAERGDRTGQVRRPNGRRHRQQPAAARWLPGRDLGGEGGPLRAHVRRLRRAAGGHRGCAGLPARGRPGVGRRGPPGAKLLHAFAEASVPRVTLVTRKSYGGAYIAMNSRALGATRVFAWPEAEIGVMGAVAAVRILYRRKLAGVPTERRHEVELELAAEHEKESGGLARAVDLGVVDEVIEPHRTRSAIATAIAEAFPSRGAHGNIPL